MFYKPVQSERFFERERLYSSIVWSSFRDVVSAWERKIRGWYVEPIEILLERDVIGWRRRLVRWLTKRPDTGHHVFPVLATTCLLIDALSQYRYGELGSAGRHFKLFVKDCLPSYNGSLPSVVWHFDHGNFNAGKDLKDYADVLWHGFRCGILHQAHAPLYCGINPGHSPPQFDPGKYAEYGSGATPTLQGNPCPAITLYPEHLFAEVNGFLTGYLRDLCDPNPIHDAATGVRALFKKKFTDSFGVDVTGSTL